MIIGKRTVMMTTATFETIPTPNQMMTTGAKAMIGAA